MFKIMGNFAVALACGGLLALYLPSTALADKGDVSLKLGCHATVNESHTFGNRSISHIDFFCSIANAHGSGFLHNTSVYCPIISDKTDKGSHLLGHCKIADKDKDELYWTVERSGSAGAGGGGHLGHFRWHGQVLEGLGAWHLRRDLPADGGRRHVPELRPVRRLLQPGIAAGHAQARASELYRLTGRMLRYGGPAPPRRACAPCLRVTPMHLAQGKILPSQAARPGINGQAQLPAARLPKQAGNPPTP
jgi:hypothetical protein